VQSQLDTFWADSSQACLYETVLQSLYNTSKTPVSVPFWNAYVAEYNHDPLYTAVGSYDAINLYAHVINESQSFNTNTLISEIEKINKSNSLAGAGGYAAFTPLHDIQEGYPYGYTLFVQWQPGGTKVVVPSFGSIYPPAVETGSYILPGYSGWAFNT
jgi:ABC-type branched-subunit amino acid transport system substrate-binding protein